MLVDFWTYTCINWLRTLPYTRAWSEKYKLRGLVVIGVHTPEFSIREATGERAMVGERPAGAVPDRDGQRVQDLAAFSNNYWPAVYLIDARGRVRYHHFGEAVTKKPRKMIQLLLASKRRPGGHGAGVGGGRGRRSAADLGSLRSPENYLGYQRSLGFSSPGGLVANEARTLHGACEAAAQPVAFAGNWTAGKESCC